MTPEELNFFLGITSIVVAVGLSTFMIVRDYQRRNNEEKFFSNEIKENLRIITQFFLTVNTLTSHRQDSENNENEITLSLNDFYARNFQEMADILHITKLYLPQWKTLNQEKKKLVKDVLKEFSWLMYEYYPTHMPESIRKTRWQSEWRTLDQKREFVATNVLTILN